MPHDDADTKRVRAARREIARLSAAHQLNGYDRNVLRQWEDPNFSGRRPPLSFELQEARQREIDAERAAVERERQAWLKHKQLQLELQKELEAARARKQQWRLENPELAAREDLERQQRIEADARRFREQREIQELEAKEATRRAAIRARVHHEGATSLDANDFLFWAEELATAGELDAFDRDCLRAARRLEQGPSWFEALAAAVSNLVH